MAKSAGLVSIGLCEPLFYWDWWVYPTMWVYPKLFKLFIRLL